MPRRKAQTLARPDSGQADVLENPAIAGSQPPLIDEAPSDDASAEGTAARTTGRPRTFKPTLSEGGVTLGIRTGHDWVLSFPADPGKTVKDRLGAVGFAYRDRKWKVFTNAANRPEVEALVRELKRELGDEMSVQEYSVKQVVLAFDSPPGDEITDRLHEGSFHFRSDFTWNADYTSANQQFARELMRSLPGRSRTAAAR